MTVFPALFEIPTDKTAFDKTVIADIVVANLYDQYTGCKFCCNSLTFPGTLNSGGLYQDILVDASNTNNYVSKNLVQEMFANKEPTGCPVTSCEIRDKTCVTGTYNAGHVSSKLDTVLINDGSGKPVSFRFKQNPSLFDHSSVTMAESEEYCIRCENSLSWAISNPFKVTV